MSWPNRREIGQSRANLGRSWANFGSSGRCGLMLGCRPISGRVRTTFNKVRPASGRSKQVRPASDRILPNSVRNRLDLKPGFGHIELIRAEFAPGSANIGLAWPGVNQMWTDVHFHLGDVEQSLTRHSPTSTLNRIPELPPDTPNPRPLGEPPRRSEPRRPSLGVHLRWAHVWGGLLHKAPCCGNRRPPKSGAAAAQHFEVREGARGPEFGLFQRWWSVRAPRCVKRARMSGNASRCPHNCVGAVTRIRLGP